MNKSVYIAIINVMFLYAGVMMTNTSVEAVAPPDSCFAFSAGTIVEYYDNESGDSSNPACPRDVDIPDSIGGEPVTAIDDIAFYDKQLTSVTISDSVISIGVASFASNNLTSIVIGDSVDIIKDEAFWGNKLDTIVVQGSPTTVGEGIFSNNLVPIRSISYNDVVYEAPTGQHDIPEECLWFEDGTIYEYYYGDIRTIRDHGVSCLATDIRIPGEIDSQEVHSILNERIVDETLAVPTGGFGNMHLSSVVIPIQ